jgi:hypothetical protein
MIRSFAAMFLGLPHRTTKNYTSLVKLIGSQIYGRDHRLEPYYVAAYAYYRLEYLFRNQTIPAVFKPGRYNLLFAYRLLIAGNKLPRMDSHEMEKCCNLMMESLWNDEQCKKTFISAKQVFETIANGNFNRDNIRTEPFTESLLSAIVKEV